MNVSKLVILGAGIFGSRALLHCSKAFPNSHITIVDLYKDALKYFSKSVSYDFICADGILYLDDLIENALEPTTWIIPSIPKHVAFEWIKRKIAPPVKQIDIPDTLLKKLPNVMHGNPGTVYMTYATFRCPDNCPEPEKYCYHTKLPRPINLFDEIQHLEMKGFSFIVLKSKQILPGVGGFQLQDLIDIYSQVEFSQRPACLCTACRCHGVMDAFA